MVDIPNTDITIFDDGFVLKIKVHTLKAADWAEEVLLPAPVNDRSQIIVDPDFFDYLVMTGKKHSLSIAYKEED